MEFRNLKPDDVECRIGTVKEGKGVSLLLYKTARVDMDILDETVGSMNWQKRYSRENANCEVGIWDSEKSQWIWKEDTGTESNTEKEKGLASDSFKRACFNWGIGRELYTAPFIWIQGAGKYDRFWVKEMDVENHRITKLVICSCDGYGNRIDDAAFSFPRSERVRRKKTTSAVKDTTEEEKPLTEAQRAAQAYPPRSDMLTAIVRYIPQPQIDKWIAMWGKGFADASDAQIMGMYGYYDKKGAFDEQ